MTLNPLPAFTFEDADNIAPLPAHVLDIATRRCVYCGEAPVFASYADYLDNFWRYEYEGDRYHAPDDEDHYTVITSLCLATAEEVAA